MTANHSSYDSSKMLKGVVCGVISALIWGAFPVVTRLGVEYTTLNKYDITAIRFGISGLILLPFFLRQGLRGKKWTAMAVLVIGIGPLYMLVVAQGLTYAPVETFAVITPGSMIVFSTVASAMLLKIRLTKRELAGIGLILLGITSIGMRDMRAENLSTYLIFVLGGMLWSIYTIGTKIFSISPFQAITQVSVLSMAIYLPFYFYFEGMHVFDVPFRDLSVQIFYQGILVSIVALFFYSKAVYLLGPAMGSAFAAFVPAAAAILASIILGELPGIESMVGLGVITFGMMCVIYRRK